MQTMLGNKPRGEIMNQVRTIAFRLAAASFVLCSCLAAAALAQTPSPSPSPSPEAKPANQNNGNPFAPESAPPLPAGMAGVDASDPPRQHSPREYDSGATEAGVVHT